MGHTQISDAECVSSLAFRLLQWGEKLLPGSLFPRRLEEAFESENFRAELCLIPDYEKDDGSLCVEVRLRRRGQGRHRDRFVYLKRERARQRLRNPKTWRSLGGLKKHPRQGRHRKLISLDLARDLYLGEKTPLEDIRAQLTVALVQLSLIRSDSDACQWLLHYLRGFRIWVADSLSKAERDQHRQATVFLVRDTLLNRWSFPEDYRAFRSYVARAIKRALREYRGSADVGIGTLAKEPSFVPQHAKHTLVEKLYRAEVPRGSSLGLTTEDMLSVEEAAQYIGCSKSYVYRLIREGLIKSESRRRPGGGPVRSLRDAEPIRVVPRIELGRVRHILAQRLVLRAKRKQLEQLGKTADAARKAVFRRYARSPSILSIHATERDPIQ